MLRSMLVTFQPARIHAEDDLTVAGEQPLKHSRVNKYLNAAEKAMPPSGLRKHQGGQDLFCSHSRL